MSDPHGGAHDEHGAPQTTGSSFFGLWFLLTMAVAGAVYLIYALTWL